jgi:hypothetical protein
MRNPVDLAHLLAELFQRMGAIATQRGEPL